MIGPIVILLVFGRKILIWTIADVSPYRILTRCQIHFEFKITTVGFIILLLTHERKLFEGSC
jgi:hypothetical protein